MKNVGSLICFLLLIGGAAAFTIPNSSNALKGHLTGGVTTSVLSYSRRTLAIRPPQRSFSEATQLLALSSSGDDEEYSINLSNFPFAVLWVALLIFAYFIAPGELQGSEYDQNIIQAIIDNPQKPEVNELFIFVFNQFVVIPSTLACVAIPQASRNGPSPVPFLLGAAFAGYFFLGPYMIFRGLPKESTNLKEVGWITANVLENKIFNAAVLALAVYFATHVSWTNIGSLANGYADMFRTSKLVSVSTIDLSILIAMTATLIPQDIRLRNPEQSDRANLIAASTLMLPMYGALIYCLLRPSLPKD